MAFRSSSLAKSHTITSASAPRPKARAAGKQLRRKEGWSPSDVVAAGLATEEQKAAAEQLSRGVNYYGTGEFALDDGWSVQVVTEPKQPVQQAPNVPQAPKAAPVGGKSMRQKGKVDPQSDAGSKALAGLAEFMKAKEEESRRQKEAKAAAAARAPPAAGSSKKKNKKQKAPSIFGDLPEFDSAYRKASKDNLKGEVVARLPGIDPTTGEFVPMPGQQYGVREGYGEDSKARRKAAGGGKKKLRSSLDVTMEDLLRQQGGEELIEEEEEEAVEEEVVDAFSRTSPPAAEKEEEEVTLEDLKELLSMEDSEVLSGLQDLMPDDEDLMAMLQPMLPSTPTPKPTTSTKAATLGSYSKGGSSAAGGSAPVQQLSSKEEVSVAVDDVQEEEDVSVSSPGPASIRVRQPRRRAPAPKASRVRRQFQAEVVEEVVIEEVEEVEGDFEDLTQEDSSTSSSTDPSTSSQTQHPISAQIDISRTDNVGGLVDNTSTAAATSATVTSQPLITNAVESQSTAAAVQSPSVASTSASSSGVAPETGLSPAAMLRQMQAGTLDESQLTPLARKLLQYQKQYKQVQEREKQRKATQKLIAEQQRKDKAAQMASTTSSATNVPTAGGPRAEGVPRGTGADEGEASSSEGAAQVEPVKHKSTQEEEAAKLEEQLSQYFSPRKVKKLMQDQRAVDKHNHAIAERSSPEWRANRTLHQKLRIVGGKCQARRIWSSRGPQTRPMMERVRHAVFNMLHSFTGMLDSFDPNMRCLDLFAGTGSVGIEAVSRGCSECHFVEMDPWVVKNVTRKNVDICGISSQAVYHTAKVEDFMERAIQLPKSHRPFDIISMCPPYLLVSYPQLFDLLERSPFLHEYTFVVVEYPRQLAHEIPEDLGPLTTLRDREYGRTWIRIYGPNLDEDDE